VLLHAIRKTDRSRWWNEPGKKSNTAVKLHFVIPQVLLNVNRKFDRSRGRKVRQEDEQHSCKFKLCYLPTVLHVICKREGSTERKKS
jgi:hypothetical protein